MMASCKPLPISMRTIDGPEEYREGWDHGCDAAMYMHGDFWLRMTHDYYRNPELTQDEQYIRGWDAGKTFCEDYMAHLPVKGPLGGDGWFWVEE